MAYWLAAYVLVAIGVGAILAAFDSTGNPDTTDVVGVERRTLRAIAGLFWPVMLLVWTVLGLGYLVVLLALGYSRLIERLGGLFRN